MLIILPLTFFFPITLFRNHIIIGVNQIHTTFRRFEFASFDGKYRLIYKNLNLLKFELREFETFHLSQSFDTY